MSGIRRWIRPWLPRPWHWGPASPAWQLRRSSGKSPAPLPPICHNCRKHLQHFDQKLLGICKKSSLRIAFRHLARPQRNPFYYGNHFLSQSSRQHAKSIDNSKNAFYTSGSYHKWVLLSANANLNFFRQHIFTILNIQIIVFSHLNIQTIALHCCLFRVLPMPARSSRYSGWYLGSVSLQSIITQPSVSMCYRGWSWWWIWITRCVGNGA